MKKLLFTLVCGLAVQPAVADFVINEDLIVRLDTCVGGVQCTDGMSFTTNVGNADLIVYSVNPQILFRDDTAGSDAFAFEADANVFNLYNETNNVRILGVDNDAEADSIYIGSNGNIGLFTNTPASNIELSVFAESGSIAEMRLFDTTQTWDVELASNDDFQIQDVTTGTVPFSIEDGAPTDSLSIDEFGHTNTRTLNAAFSGSNSGGDGLSKVVTLNANNSAAGKSSDVGFSLSNEMQAFSWNFRTFEGSEGFVATKDGTGGAEFEIRNTTNNYQSMSILTGNGAQLTIGGVWMDASSREFKENIQPVSLQEAMQALENIEPVQYHYKRDESKELYLGFIAEDVPQLVSAQGRKNMAAMEVVAMLTKVVQHQQKLMQEQHRMNETLMEKMVSLEKMVKLNSMVALQQ